MKESPKRYINAFLSDVENDKVNFTTNLDDECQLPEMVTCYEESSFNVVKDICVDDGLSHGEMIKCNKEHHELSCNSFTVNGDKHDHMIDDRSNDMIKDDLDTQLISTPLEDKIKFFVNSNIVNSNQNFGPDNAMHNGEEKLDSGSNSLNNSIRILEPANNDVDDVDQLLSEAQFVGFEANEPSQTNHTIDTQSEITIDTQSEIMMEENTILSADNVKPTTANGPHELPLSTESAPNHQRGGGESSFSMAGPVSGLITYSGPITAVGSISHRSDGSNTSVRSFAFPILQNEWNSSPVRMAKADPKQSRKHRGWRQALMCCRF